MSRRRLPALALLAAVLAMALGLLPPRPALAAAKPNLVVIMLDDLDAATIAYMPATMQQIAAQGVSFDRSYVTDPLCFPSRAAFFSGRYPHSTGQRKGGYYSFIKRVDERNTLGPWLQAAGYYTAFAGKYINNYPSARPDTYVPPGWNRWAAALYEKFYKQYDYTMNEDGKLVTYGTAATDYFGDVVTRKSLAFIDDAHARGKPLALIVAPSAPHVPLVAAPRDRSTFGGATAPRSAAFPEADTRDKPPFNRFSPITGTALGNLDLQYRGRLRMLGAADDLVAAIVAALQQRGMLDNTYILVTSDNGYHMGQHNLAPNKETPYEEDIRVPLLVRGPGVPRNAHLQHLISHLDVAPTLVALGGGTAPAAAEGRSFASLLTASPPSPTGWRQAILITRLPAGTLPPPPPKPPVTAAYNCVPNATPSAVLPEYWAVRTNRYTYTEYANGDRELYDDQADPLQLVNLYCAATAELKASLSAAIARLRACSGATCRTAENVAVP